MFDVGSLLQLPSVRAGIPEVAAGAAGLSAAVRWLHVGDLGSLSHYLKGGEAILTNGTGFGRDAEARLETLRGLTDVGVVAIILELGVVYTSVPVEIREECDRAGIPLITLGRPVAFVDISHEVHSVLVDQRVSVLSRQSALSDLFLSQVLEGASLAQLLELLSEQVGNPVLLIDHLGALAGSAGRGIPENELLIAQGGIEPARRLSAPLPGGGVSGWSLMVIPLLSRLTDHDRLAATEAARAISLMLARGHVATELRWRDPHMFVLDLLDDEMAPGMVALQATHVGFDARILVPFALVDTTEEIDSDSWNELAQSVRRLPGARLISSLKLGTALGVIGLEDVRHKRSRADDLLAKVEALTARLTAGKPVTLVVGEGYRSWKPLAPGMRRVRAATQYVVDRGLTGVYDMSEPDVDRLIAAMKEAPEFQEFVRLRLEPVRRQDAERSSTLMQTLVAFCQNGGRKSETAKALHIERSSLYDRLGRLEALLECSFNDAATFMGLQLAVAAYLQTGAVAHDR